MMNDPHKEVDQLPVKAPDSIDDNINAQTKRYNLNTKRIRGLMSLGDDIDTIAKTLNLHPETVRVRVRELEKRDLCSSEFVDLAALALKTNLALGKMQAVKMVYDRAHPKEPDTIVHKGSGKAVEVHLTLDVSRLKGSGNEKIIDADSFDDRAIVVEGERV